MRITFAYLSLCVAAVTANLEAIPPSMNPSDVGIAYDIVAVRMPRAGNDIVQAFPDAANLSLHVGRGADLVLIHPDGTEELLFDPGQLASVVDPLVSFDGSTIYFSVFVDPQNMNPLRWIPRSPAHLWKIDLATRVATQLTFGNKPNFADTSHKFDPDYALFDVAPVELPDGRLLFLSNRDSGIGQKRTPWGVMPSMSFWRMNADGTNMERLERFSQAGCQHPFILRDGRIVWTHYHPAGRRFFGSTFPLMVASQDLSDFKSFAGMHDHSVAWHFSTELSSGDVVSTAYYYFHSFGHGALVRFPVDPGHATGQVFEPIDDAAWPDYHIYGQNDHFSRVGQNLVTPWSVLAHPSLSHDGPSPILTDGTYAGKSTMPAGAPGDNLLFVWSDGPVHVSVPTGFPRMKIAFAAGGWLTKRDDLVVLKESPDHHYMHPKAVVPYSAIYGVEKPATLAAPENEGGATALLPAGGPFATVGTSSVYNRESRWPAAYKDLFDNGPSNDYTQFTAVFVVGQDSRVFQNADIHAAQVVADMSHVETGYATNAPFRSHNNGSQIWGVLGELPLRKFDALDQPILDPRGDPDTSYEVRIPADVPFHNRVLDEYGMRLTSEETWNSARPGERKTNCGGCHAHSTNVTPLDFDLTAAARPGYAMADFALHTPMIDRDAMNQPTVTTFPERVRIYEYYRDVKPILDAKCISCHGDVSPAGELDLEGVEAVQKLAFDSAASGLKGEHQATRWIRRQSANRSLLVWKLFGQRLDGKTNASHADDVDYVGEIMPPPSSGIAPLTFQEKRTIALWIDLGCLTATFPGTPTVGDPFDDQMAPTLVVSNVPATTSHGGPTASIRVGVYDLHDGTDPTSLDVKVTPAGGSPSSNLAAGMTVPDGSVSDVPVPMAAATVDHVIDVAVKDLAGNVSRRTITVPACAGSFQVMGGACGAPPPSLSASGCPSTDRPMTIQLAGGPPGGKGFAVVSNGSTILPMNPDCSLHVKLPAWFVPVPVDGSGGLQFTFTTPPVAPADTYIQVIFVDSTQAYGISATNLLRITTG